MWDPAPLQIVHVLNLTVCSVGAGPAFNGFWVKSLFIHLNIIVRILGLIDVSGKSG